MRSPKNSAARFRKLTGLSATKLAGRFLSSGLSVFMWNACLTAVTGAKTGKDECEISTHRQHVPAIDCDDAAGHEGTRIGSQQQQRAVEFFNPARTLHRHARQEAPAGIAGQERIVELGGK